MAGAGDGWQTDLLLMAFEVGDRVQVHPAHDYWMKGDRFGVVESIGHRYVSVRMDRSKKLARFVPENLEAVK